MGHPLDRERKARLRARKLLLYTDALGLQLPVVDVEALADDRAFALALSHVAAVAPRGAAFALGRARRVGDLGLLGHVILSCATLGDVLTLWLQHAESAGELIKLGSTIDDDGQTAIWTTRYEADVLLDEASARFCMEESCATFFAFCSEVTGSSFADFEVMLAGSYPADALAGAFPGKVVAGAEGFMIRGPASALDLPVIGADAETMKLLLLRLTSDDSPPCRAEAGPVERALVGFLASRRASVPAQSEAAEAIGVSTRTLVLRLSREGTSYSAVLDRYRRAYAMALIEEGSLRPKQIAHALGFRHANSFRRAFRGWTGRALGNALATRGPGSGRS